MNVTDGSGQSEVQVVNAQDHEGQMPEDFGWERFWCPQGKEPRVDLDGFLADPTVWQGATLCTLEQMTGSRCQILLGEPGSGKTMTLRGALPSLEKDIESRGGKVLFRDLGAVGSDSTFDSDVVHHPLVESWRSGVHELTLILDSLDECIPRVPVKRLVAAIREMPVDRLRLVIASRSVDWPSTLEKGLRGLWARSEINVSFLAPLRRVDVARAAELSGVRYQEFIDAVAQNGATALAVRPLTLRLLLSEYRERGSSLSLSRTELFRKGCNRLCKESQEWLEGGLAGHLTVSQRLAIAQRIAAVVVLSRKGAVNVADGGRSAGDVPVEDLTGGSEPGAGERVPVPEQAVRETLRTAMFTVVGEGRVRFSHQAYADFLAARYLIDNSVQGAQLRSLLKHPGDSLGRIVPHLTEMASWLAGMSRQTFSDILEIEPEILLEVDPSMTTPTMREDLAGRILERARADRLFERDYMGRTRPRFSGLAHDGLAGQLTSLLRDASAPFRARVVAVDIAVACATTDVSGTLADLALDRQEALDLREAAAAGVVRVAPSPVKARLKPLLKEDPEVDSDDQLKGCALFACWPEALTTTELLTVLDAPRNESFFGAYWQFLTTPPAIPDDGLLEALEWTRGIGDRHSFRADPREALVEGVLVSAFHHSEAPMIEEALATAILERLRAGRPEAVESVFRAAVSGPDAERRRLAERLVEELASLDDAIAFLRVRPRLLLPEDVGWLLEGVRLNDQNRLQVLVELVSAVADAGQYGRLLEVKDEIPLLGQRLPWLFGPVELGSPLAGGGIL